MPLTDVLVLPPDVLVIPVTRLGAGLRRRIDAADSDFAVTRVRRRSSSKVVNQAAAEMLQLFRTPRRVVDVVQDQGRKRQVDPEQLLSDVFPLLRDCFDTGFLVPAGSPEADLVQSTLVRGDRLGEFEILRSVQVLEDTELYQARSARGALVAIKLATRGSSKATRESLASEARILTLLGGHGAPALLTRGTHDRLPYLVMSWCPGSPPTVAFAAAHRIGDRALMLRLAVALVEDYAAMHQAGVVHGDVQPNNLLIDPDGRVTILDFGCGRILRQGAAPRGGVAFYIEPEQARRALRGWAAPAATPASDQYSLAALLYELFTGEHYLDFSLEREAMLSQIAVQPPLSFAERGQIPWPQLERVLTRALQKDPRRRYASMTSFARSLRRIRLDAGKTFAIRSRSESLELLCRDFVRQCEPGGRYFAAALDYAPFGSVTFGGAGIAFALYRIGARMEDGLAAGYADAWLNRIENHLAPHAFYNESMEITPGVVGTVSPYHTAAGIHCCRAMLGRATGSTGWVAPAIDRFIASSRDGCESLDLTLGRSGSLLAAAMLGECVSSALATGAPLRTFGTETLTAIWRELDLLPPPGSSTELSVGIAHGWAGVLYATLSWCRASRSPWPARMEERLDQLAACADPELSSWCNGSAGMIHLWTLAHTAFQSARYLELAERAGMSTADAVDPAANLCCGVAGRVYGLLNLYRHTGDGKWLARAHALAAPLVRGARGIEVPVDGLSLYKGTGGVATMAADLLRAEHSSMPFFELEPWPHRPGDDA